MHATEKKQFFNMLSETMAAYGKPLPEGALLAAWWTNLEPFPLPVVAMALTTYRDENGEFAPVPAGIAKRCKLLDGRPTADEAWAIALTSIDERETVVWTDEAAEAFALCRPVLSMGDKVGARRTFIDAYTRLVTEARASGKLAKWNVSEGWDKSRKLEVVDKAVRAGLLPAPVAREMLPNYSTAKPQECPEGLKRLKEELSKLEDARVKADRIRAAKVESERLAVDRRKQELAEQAESLQMPEKVRA